MAEKEPTSVNLRVDHKDWMDSESINRSQLINKLLTEYRSSDGGESDAVKQLRATQLETEIRTHQKTAEMKQNELESLEENITGTEEHETTVWNEALSELSFSEFSVTDDVMIDSPDGMIQYYAEELNMDTETFVNELTERYKDND